ncbi:MAG TPA: hypothetical protein VI933_02315 [archaeon]|nr:hypothetical protein [archaeon]
MRKTPEEVRVLKYLFGSGNANILFLKYIVQPNLRRDDNALFLSGADKVIYRGLEYYKFSSEARRAGRGPVLEIIYRRKYRRKI